MNLLSKRLFIAFGFAAYAALMLYLGLNRGQEETREQACSRRCAPRVGVVENSGPRYGPEWRSPHRESVCVCK